MKLSYEPVRAVGGAFTLVGVLSALAIYYDVVTPEAAVLWSSLLMIVGPTIQGEISRLYTWATAKIADAAVVDPGLHPEAINDKAEAGRNRKRAYRKETGASV